MNKTLLIGVVAVLILAGLYFGFNALTPTTLTNQQIVQQVKYCKSNGLKSERFIIPLTGETTKIECRVP